MPTRRHALITAGTLLATGIGVGSLAFSNSSTSPSADFRIIAPPALLLTPGRPDHAHVAVEPVDGVDHVRSVTIEASSQRAANRFEHLVEVTNNIEQDVVELFFEFDIESDDADPADIAGALSIVSATDAIDGTGETDYLTIADTSGEDPDVLAPGESVAFGVAVDLGPDNENTLLEAFPDPASFEAVLTLSASLD